MTTYANGVPEPIVTQLIELLPPQSHVLDIGCGEGRNAIPLARHGMRVEGWDKKEADLAILNLRAAEQKVLIKTVPCDLRDLHIGYDKWGAILTILCLHFLTPEQAKERLLRIRSTIIPSGYHAMVVFTDIGSFAKLRNDRFFPKKEEIVEAYRKAEWEILTEEVDTVDCLQTTATGVPYQNERLTLLARKSSKPFAKPVHR